MPARRALETVIAGGVGSASANLWPVYLASINKGLFAAEDLKIDLVFSQSNAGTIQQLAVDALNVSIASGLVDPIRAIEKGAPVAIVRIEAQRPPYAVLGKARHQEHAGAQRQGRLRRRRQGHHPHLFRAHGAREGVEPKDVDLIFAGATSARYAALQSGAADAAILTAPYNFAAAAGFTVLGLTSISSICPFPASRPTAIGPRATQPPFGNTLQPPTKSIHWLADPGNRREAVDIMVSVSNLKADDVEKSYDFLVVGGFFERRHGLASKARKVIEALQSSGMCPQASQPIDCFCRGSRR
jgi:hypothetical protein